MVENRRYVTDLEDSQFLLDMLVDGQVELHSVSQLQDKMDCLVNIYRQEQEDKKAQPQGEKQDIWESQLEQFQELGDMKEQVLDREPLQNLY